MFIITLKLFHLEKDTSNFSVPPPANFIKIIVIKNGSLIFKEKVVWYFLLFFFCVFKRKPPGPQFLKSTNFARMISFHCKVIATSTVMSNLRLKILITILGDDSMMGSKIDKKKYLTGWLISKASNEWTLAHFKFLIS